jgi:hypothetical protein
MKEIRDIKLDLLMGNHNPMVDLFNEITKDLQIINCEVYNDDGLEFIYFVPTKNEWIFYQDVKNGEFWCNYTRYWSLFESNFSLKYEEMQAITKYLVEEALKREVDTPNEIGGITSVMVEEALNRELSTSELHFQTQNLEVEEALKREVTTPMIKKSFYLTGVEEALMREVTTPFPPSKPSELKVEEALNRKVARPSASNVRLFYQVEDALKRKLL